MIRCCVRPCHYLVASKCVFNSETRPLSRAQEMSKNISNLYPANLVSSIFHGTTTIAPYRVSHTELLDKGIAESDIVLACKLRKSSQVLLISLYTKSLSNVSIQYSRPVTLPNTFCCNFCFVAFVLLSLSSIGSTKATALKRGW